MTGRQTFRWAAEDKPITARMIFLSATTGTHGPGQLVPAWELYQGGCLPQLRERLGDHPDHRGRVRLISAEYGLLHPDTQVPPSKRLMTAERAQQLRPAARRALLNEFTRQGVPREIMMLAEHPYHLVVADVFRIPNRRPYTSLSTARPAAQWSLISAVLDKWGWP